MFIVSAGVSDPFHLDTDPALDPTSNREITNIFFEFFFAIKIYFSNENGLINLLQARL